MPKQRGFTLLEVIVAMAVLAIALASLVKSAGNNASNTAHLRDKTFAHWIAMNKLTELEIAQSWPDIGTRNGTAEMADREWYWQTKVEKTEDEYVRRLRIEVGLDQDSGPLSALTAFLGSKKK